MEKQRKHAGKPVEGHAWRPVKDLDPSLAGYRHETARRRAEEWKVLRARMEDRKLDRSLMDRWLLEQKRAFAIETGQVESLYLLRKGVTETLVSEGFEGVRGSHSVTEIEDDTLAGLLNDQKAALDMVFSHVKDKRPLNLTAIKEWHALLTRHQESATGFSPVTGKIIQIPLRRGEFKVLPNNPRTADGTTHEYCPPEQTRQQVEMFLEMNETHKNMDLSPEMESAWMHHEFVQIHPFQDGNGRVSRLLMSIPWIRAGEFPPVIANETKLAYYDALQAADEGKLEVFARYLGEKSADRCLGAIMRAEAVLSGSETARTTNGGIFHSRKGYFPPPGGRGPGTC